MVRLREGACEVGCVTAYFVLCGIGEQAMVADGTELHSAEAFLPVRVTCAVCCGVRSNVCCTLCCALLCCCAMLAAAFVLVSPKNAS